MRPFARACVADHQVTVARCRACFQTQHTVSSRRHFSADATVSEEANSNTLEEDALLQATSDKPEPWKTILEMPARAAWRVSAPRPPEAFEKAQTHVLDKGGRSSKHMKRTLQEVIASHRSIADKRERERFRTVTDRGYKTKDKKRDETVKPVLYGPDETLALLRFRLYPNYCVAKRVLDETRSLIGRDVFHPRRVLDFGLGCGGATAAALDTYEGIEWIHGIDPSETMRQGAKCFLDKFIEESHKNTNPQITLSSHLSSESSPPAFDLALFTYTATELLHNASTLAAAAILWGKLRPDGVFVMIEPGTPDGFSSVRQVRNMLLACCPPEEGEPGDEECHVIAPCTHNGSCPMDRFKDFRKENQSSHEGDKDETSGDVFNPADSDEDDDDGDGDDESRKGYCGFVQMLPGIYGKRKSEKFSYLVMQKRIAGQPRSDAHRFDDVNLTDLMVQTQSSKKTSPGRSGQNRKQLLRDAVNLESRFLNSDDDDLGLELLRGDNRSSFARITHAPKKKKGHIIVEGCAAPGKLVTHTIPKSMSNDLPGIYAAARKSRWGGFWPSDPKQLD